MRARRWILSSLVLAGIGIGCATGFDPPSRVEGLRVLGVEADIPYAQPGDTVTLKMTVTDGLGDANGQPRPLQIVWIGGCVDPTGDQYYLCFEQFASLFAGLGSGKPSSDLKFATTTPAEDGSPGVASFSFKVPEDIVSRRPPPDDGPHYGIEYVFFAACAGTIAPADFKQTGAVPDFPLKCLDADGNAQGADSFVPGYTQIYAFADGRSNDNPPITGLSLDDQELPTDPALAPVLPRCAVTEEDRKKTGCAKVSGLDACTEYKLSATVPDVAEPLPDSSPATGGALRETVWVTYLANGGSLSSGIALVSDSVTGYVSDHSTKWIAPSEPGLYSVWGVVRDQQGGQNIRRGYVRIE